MKGRWRPEFGLVSLPEAEGKAVAAPSTGYSSSTQPIPSPQTQTQGGTDGRAGGGALCAPVGACSRPRASNASPPAP